MPVLVSLPVCMPDDAHEDDGQAETDSGRGGVCGEELSQYAYVEYCLRSETKASVDIKRADGGEAGSLLAAGYAVARILGQVDNRWIESVSFDGTDIGTDDMVLIVMKYRMKLPFSILGLSSVPVQHVCSRRMWNGADGGGLGRGKHQTVQKKNLFI